MPFDEEKIRRGAAPPNPNTAAPVPPQQTQRPSSARSGPSFRDAARAELTAPTNSGPVEGQRTYIDDSGIARREGRMITPGGGSRPDRIGTSFRAGAMTGAAGRKPLNEQRVFDLESGRGANGEPIFDNASIQRGVQQGTIADPQAEDARIQRNQEQAAAATLRTLPQDLASGRVAPDAGEQIRGAVNDADNARIAGFRAETERLDTVSNLRGREVSAGFGTQSGRSSGGEQRLQQQVEAVLNERRAQAGLSERTNLAGPVTVRQEADRLVNTNVLPSDTTASDVALLQTLVDLGPDLDGFWFNAEPEEGLGLADAVAGVDSLALSLARGEDVFDLGTGDARLSKVPEAVRTPLAAFARERLKFLEEQVDAAIAGGPSEWKDLTGAAREIAVDRAKARLAQFNAEKEEQNPTPRRAGAGVEAQGLSLRDRAGRDPKPRNLSFSDDTELLDWYSQTFRRNNEDRPNG